MPRTPTSIAMQLAATNFRTHSRDLYRYLLRRIGRPQDADDLAQEIFSRALRIKDAELVRDPLPYLTGIAAHVLHEYYQRRQNECVMFDSELADSRADDSNQEVPPNPAEQHEIRHRLEQALMQLSPTHRLVLLLVKRDGFFILGSCRCFWSLGPHRRKVSG